ncbi:LRP1B [Branchiostoma lanceolatum]|uniref:LRP1B protein n=1 Tax=Branchiostoma lanceolatum TaxID=7740 RepID=A0A8K0EZ88_BRALA|nr:LRP1B [Branchiostoma lanceolatum]
MATGLLVLACLLSIGLAECPHDPAAVCDGVVHCLDGSDEENCWSKECYNPDDIRCESSGVCVRPEWQCNRWVDCEDGSDEEDCKSKECFIPSDFKCESNGVCVRSNAQCDGWNTCEDGSDEEGCTSNECDHPDFFKCEVGGCFGLEFQCDGRNSCDDGSDEENCWSKECPYPDYIRCKGNGGCVHPLVQCNGQVECEDGSDEENCWSKECFFPDDIKCESNGVCVRPEWQCNGWAECDDGSDEVNCTIKECYRPDDIKCESNGVCVRPEWQCDGQAECEDRSDEVNCESKECYRTEDLKCESNGNCFSPWLQCDGWGDCEDLSDEEDCLRKTCYYPDYIKCASDGVCVRPEWQCDGENHCDDGSDEQNCWSIECYLPGHMKCESNGACVFLGNQCNGYDDCEDGSDEVNCASKECYYPDNFKCESNGVCVSAWLQCDGGEDCEDGSDEICTADDCPPSHYFCGFGSCIPDTKLCDGVRDCYDESDEIGCVCTIVEFRCENSGECVPPYGVCDGVTDCEDASEELMCQSCAEQGLWQCGSGECINTAWVCDGDKDCSFGIDEENCHTPCNGLQLECDERCLPKYRACDGLFELLEDCSNGEDEINCTIGGCGANQFRCANGSCLSESQLCDNLTDCSGGEDEEDCGDVPPPGFPLGLASRYIPDVYVTASSEYKSEFAPSQARHTPPTTPGYCWVPSSVVGQWLQVYFGKTTDVTGVVISGGGSNWDLGSWVTSFTLAFSMDGTSWAPYEDRSHNVQVEVFQGNRDRYNKVSRPLPAPVTSRYIRLHPTGHEGWVAMVMEVYVTDGENTWMTQDEYFPLGVGLDPDDPAAVPKIPDLYMTASSRRAQFYPWLARLNNGRGQQRGACWFSDLGHDTNRWLQITHDKVYAVVGVITQGAYNMDFWVTSYKMAFSVDGEWRMYTNSTGDGEEMVFQGNSDSYRYARNLLDKPTFALYTRFYPLTFHNQIALRVEILIKHDILEAECGLELAMELEDLRCLEIDSQFSACGDGDVFHDSQACDGIEDCSTLEDEENCDECGMECPTDSGDPCIPTGWICDGLRDCLDGRDEQCLQACVVQRLAILPLELWEDPGFDPGCVAHRTCTLQERVAVLRTGRVVNLLKRVPKHCFFTCRNNVTCLPTSQLGDGHRDCSDGEDERPRDIEDALGSMWGSCSFNCASIYGKASCVPDAFSCDGDADCLEEEDEEGCGGVAPTAEDCPTFYCGLSGSPDPYCVQEHLICDGYPDCAAGEDEQGCGSSQPIEVCLTFYCAHPGYQDPTYCVHSHLICDGYPDCAAGEDEQGCDTTDVASTQASTTPSFGPTAEPTNGQISFEDQTVLDAGSHGSKYQPMMWMTAAALVGHTLYRLAF